HLLERQWRCFITSLGQRPRYIERLGASAESATQPGALVQSHTNVRPTRRRVRAGTRGILPERCGCDGCSSWVSTYSRGASNSLGLTEKRVVAALPVKAAIVRGRGL